MHPILEKVEEDFNKLFPPEKKVRWIRWQTWQFDAEKPKIYSCGVCELHDFLFHIKEATWYIGQRTYWREINIREM